MEKALVEALKAKDADLAAEAESLNAQIKPLFERINQVMQARNGIQALLIAEGVIQPPNPVPGNIVFAPGFSFNGQPFGNMATAGTTQQPPLPILLITTLADGVPRTSSELAQIAEQRGYKFDGKSGARVVHTTMMGIQPKGAYVKEGDHWRFAGVNAARQQETNNAAP